jgi:hypothetical protein
MSGYVGLYAIDGSWNVTVVSGLSYTGLYAADGSLNVIQSPNPATTYVGCYHPCGAMYVTDTSGGSPPPPATGLQTDMSSSTDEWFFII